MLGYAHVHKAYGGAVDRRGQQNFVFGTLVGLNYQTIRGIMKQVFRRFRLIRYAYESLRCLDIEISDSGVFVLTADRQTDTQTDCFTPAAHARTRGN